MVRLGRSLTKTEPVRFLPQPADGSYGILSGIPSRDESLAVEDVATVRASLRETMTVLVSGVDGLQSLVGAELPPSDWLDVAQERVDAFAAATGDAQWVHVDRERAKKGLFGTTVAHGFLTLALIPCLWREVVRIDGLRMTVNSGLNRVRFPAPLPIPSRIRARFRIDEVRQDSTCTRTLLHATVERDSGEKPVCIATLVFRHYSLDETQNERANER